MSHLSNIIYILSRMVTAVFFLAPRLAFWHPRPEMLALALAAMRRSHAAKRLTPT